MKNNKLPFFLILILFAVFNSEVNAQNYSLAAHQHFRKSLDYLLNGDYANAIKSSDNALKFDPYFVLSYVIRARAHYELNELDKTIADCSTAIKLDSGNASAYTVRGNAYWRKDDIIKAISDWQSALRIDPNNTEALNRIEYAAQQLRNDILMTNVE